eukprot:jgi/Botrbrau1/21260/Bobra.39_2s0052.1
MAWRSLTRSALWSLRSAESGRFFRSAFSVSHRQTVSRKGRVHGHYLRLSALQDAMMSSEALAASIKKAAFLVIGNEILSGSIVDANTPWLAKLLHSRGVDLIRVEYIPDDADDIVASVLRLKERVGETGFVFTSGGIGPTHDDVTYEAIAKAFGLKLAQHGPTVALMQEHYEKRGVELNAARLRMAALPIGAEVLTTPGLWVPLVNVHGVLHSAGHTQALQCHAGRQQGPLHWPHPLLCDSVHQPRGRRCCRPPS